MEQDQLGEGSLHRGMKSYLAKSVYSFQDDLLMTGG